MFTRKFQNICAFAVLVSGILVLAIVPDAVDGLSLGGNEKHLLAFTVLSGFAVLLWPAASPAVIWSALTAFGGMIELLQGWMAIGRHAQLSDWFIDICAVTFTLAVIGVARLSRGGMKPELA